MRLRIVATIAFVTISIGCTPYVGKKPEQTTAPVKNTEPVTTVATPTQQVVSEKKLPLTLIDTLNKGKEYALTESDFTPPSTKTGKVTPTTVQSESAIKFRIQVVASSQPDRLKEDKKKLEKQISVPLTILQEAAYFKLYAGEFVQKADADLLLQKIKKLGYTDAWVASTKGGSAKP